MSSSGSDLYDTETPQDYGTCSQEVQMAKVVCGKLMATTIYLPSIVLDKPEFILGRAKECDVVVTKSNFSRNSIHTISKNHFKITCNPDTLSVSITDLSKNGTFVNYTVIGKDRQVILKDNDLISIGTSGLGVYIYRKTDRSNDSYLPVELKEKYKFIKLLGSGACGEVVLVCDLISNQKYAVKKVNKGKLSDKDNLNNPLRIKNEVSIMQSVSHPCIISAEEIIETDEAVYIVLEYMDGGELTDKIMSFPTPLPENEVKILFYQIVLGLRYLHLRNITHRDLKPGNILLQSKSVVTLVKIADFGLSKITETSSGLDTCCGTPCYIAPEVIDRRHGPYTQQVDVWSLGVILFYMLSRELPFQVESNCPREIIKLIVYGSYSMTSQNWSSVSLGAKDLITKMLRKNPEERYTIHEVANHPWLAKDTFMQQQVKQILENYTNACKKVPQENCDDLPPPKKLKID